MKKEDKCEYETCKKAKETGKYCNVHYKKCNISAFLSKKYSNMKQRVEGKFAHTMKRSTQYVGLPILSREEFYAWAKASPEFLGLYKQWAMCGFDLRLTPTVNRMRSSEGYILGNMEWLTNSQNCGLTGAVRTLNRKKAVYDLLGVEKDGKS